MTDKVYVPKCSAKEFVFKTGHSQIKLGFKVDALIEFVKAHANEKGYVNLIVSKRKEVSQYGETHCVCLDTWVPGQRTGGTSAPADQPTEAQKLLAQRKQGGLPASAPAPAFDENEDVPF